jgi:NAD(P)-dependent dehydrogenase (short-subunit alcohol dehydrogenase family)
LNGIDSRPGTGKSKVEDYDIASWNNILEVNLLGFVRVMNTILFSKFSPINIVVVGSLYASVSPNYHLYSHFNLGKGQIKHPAYSASKSALKSVMKQYSTLLSKNGIRINMLSPGGVLANQDQEFIDNFSSVTPIGRLAKSEELISSMKFLLDESNSYLVGHDLLIDGGYSSW